LNIINEGIYICFAKVQDWVFEEYRTEHHAFVYDSTYKSSEAPWCIGAIIDNRQEKPVRLIEHTDRESIENARNVLDTFFNAHSVVTSFYHVTKKY
jgi:hypothetical protein